MKVYFICFFLFYIQSIVCEYSFKTKYADIVIDHFSYTRNDTFKLKYLINDTFWSNGGPIFFYTGNEGSIELFAQNTGFMWEIADTYGALIIFCEHRYYGTSLPFGNLSYSKPEFLGYLTSEQALEDFVDVLDILQKSTYGSDGPLPVIVFGGSYGGMLSAWMRMKYPASVLGAIASSAPIWQFTDLTPCGIFNSIVTQVYASSVEDIDCSIPIKSFWPALRRVTKTVDGKTWLSSTWKLCKNITQDDDVQKLIDAITDALTNVAMVNYPYASQFLANLPPNPVNAICSELRNYETYSKDDKKLIFAVANALNIYTNYTGKANCTDFSDTGALNTYGWDFQSCTEVVMPMCSEKDSMFETSTWDLKAYSQNCFKKFGVKPNNPREIILKYGGKNLKYASNIVFSNGLLDPWSGGGVLSNISETVTAIVIPEAAHHLDLRAANPTDPPSVNRARKFIKNSISGWLNQYQKMKFGGNEHQVLRVR